MLYTIKLGPFQTIRKVKGHYFAADLPSGFMVIVKNNEKKIIVNTNKYKTITLSKEFFLSQVSTVKKESNGMVNDSMISSDALNK